VKLGRHKPASDGSYRVGDAVLVAGGYDQDPEWLQGGPGYSGTIREIAGKRAIVELTSEIVLTAGHSDGWPNFGEGGQSESGRLSVARGATIRGTRSMACTDSGVCRRRVA
jgi:hypothetical protein